MVSSDFDHGRYLWPVGLLSKEERGSAGWEKGDHVVHPDGRTVIITGGQWQGTYGLSNAWTWVEYLGDAAGDIMVGPTEHGYGWDAPGRRPG